MRVELEIDPRHDPGGDRHPLAPNWITIRRDRRFQGRNSAKLQWQHILEKIGSRHGDHSQVAIIRYELYFGRILIGIAVPLHGQVTAVGNNVCVRHDAIAAYDEAGANAALEPSSVPRRFVVRLDRSRGNPDQTFLNGTVWFWRRNWYRDWNCFLRRRARSPWTRPRLALRLHWGTRGCAFLRVQNRSKQQGGVN